LNGSSQLSIRLANCCEIWGLLTFFSIAASLITEHALLLAFAASGALLAVLFGLIAALSGWRWPRLPGILAWLACALLAEIGIMGSTLSADTYTLAGALLFGLSVFGLEIVQALFEVRRFPDRRPVAALGAGVGLLIGVSTLLVPVIPGQLAPLTRPTSTATFIATTLPTHTPRVSATATLRPSRTPTATALPSLTPTPSFSAPLATPSAAGSAPSIVPPSAVVTRTASTSTQVSSPNISGSPLPCTITINKNANLRAMPSVDSQLLLTIPFGSTVNGTARAKGWWRVHYRDQDGWLIASAVTASEGCAALPIGT